MIINLFAPSGNYVFAIKSSGFNTAYKRLSHKRASKGWLISKHEHVSPERKSSGMQATLFPSTYSLLITVYVYHRYCWSDCYQLLMLLLFFNLCWCFIYMSWWLQDGGCWDSSVVESSPIDLRFNPLTRHPVFCKGEFFTYI